MTSPSEKIVAMLHSLPPEFSAKIRSDNALAAFGFSTWDAKEAAQTISKAAEIAYPISQALLPEACDFLERRRFDLLRCTRDACFVTSDDPIVLLKNGAVHLSKGGIGEVLKDEHIEVLLPLSPKLACLWRHGAEFRTVDVDDAHCGELNRFIYDSAYSQVYAHNKSHLESLLQRNP
jgi:hypothetical protein